MASLQCGKCQQHMYPSHFLMGGRTCQICASCRGYMRHVPACERCAVPFDPDKFQWRFDTRKGGWRKICQDCQNVGKYYVKHRQKRRAEDEEGFLAHQNAVQRCWRDANPELVQEALLKRKADVESRWGKLKASAKYHGTPLDENAKGDFQSMMTCSCFYCGYLPDDGDRLNGIDQVVPNCGYVLSKLSHVVRSAIA